MVSKYLDLVLHKNLKQILSLVFPLLQHLYVWNRPLGKKLFFLHIIRGGTGSFRVKEIWVYLPSTSAAGPPGSKQAILHVASRNVIRYKLSGEKQQNVYLKPCSGVLVHKHQLLIFQKNFKGGVKPLVA